MHCNGQQFTSLKVKVLPDCQEYFVSAENKQRGFRVRNYASPEDKHNDIEAKNELAQGRKALNNYKLGLKFDSKGSSHRQYPVLYSFY
jgi:hypothetical protein